MDKLLKMKQRTDDDDFNKCRSVAYDAMDNIKKRLELEFDAL
jgi:hypothetical protein